MDRPFVLQLVTAIAGRPGTSAPARLGRRWRRPAVRARCAHEAGYV